jgi:hypothetical protein
MVTGCNEEEMIALHLQVRKKNKKNGGGGRYLLYNYFRFSWFRVFRLCSSWLWYDGLLEDSVQHETMERVTSDMVIWMNREKCGRRQSWPNWKYSMRQYIQYWNSRVSWTIWTLTTAMGCTFRTLTISNRHTVVNQYANGVFVSFIQEN